MSTPITPVVVSTVQQAQAEIDSSQVAALVSAIEGANIITLPNSATFSNVQSFAINLLPNGSARVNLSIRS
jgi:hypothetical protein